MSRHGAPSGLAWQVGDVYTLHLWPPFGVPGVQQSGHYTGWALEGRLPYRLTDHDMGRGARLTQLQREAGGSWVLANVERGVTKDREHQLKYRGASRRCEVCKAQRDLERGRITPEQALARSGWDRASEYQRGLLLEIFGLDEAPATLAVRPPAPPEPAPFVPAPAPGELGPAELAEVDALVDALVAGWKAEAASPKGAEVEPEPEAG
jgi:hypothetical protein